MFLIKQINEIDEIQFGFSPGQGKTDLVFILRQLQGKYLVKHTKLYTAFVDLEKAFDRVPWKLLWWALHVVGVPEWLVKVVQAMYVGAKSRTCVHTPFSEEFEVKVGVHQGSALKALLFLIVLVVRSLKFQLRCPMQMICSF